MKEMSKVKIYQKKSVRSILYEKSILASLKHPFIANLYYAFQDFDSLFLILDYLPGGDLRYYLTNQVTFTENQISKKI